MGDIVGAVIGAGASLLGGGGGGGSSSSYSQPILPDYLKSALEGNVSRANEVFNRPFEAYLGSDAVSPLSSDEDLAFTQLRDVLFGRTLPLFNQSQDLITRAGERAEFGPQAGQLDPYMNPFQQGVTDIGKLEAIRNWENEFQNIHGAANKVNAFGGSGQRILESESYKNIAERLDDLQMQGDYANYNQAMDRFTQGTGLMANTALGQGSLAASGQNVQLGDVGALSAAGGTQRGIDQAMLDVDFSEFLRGQGWDQQQIQGLSNILAQTGNVIGGQSAQITQPSQDGNPFSQAVGGALAGSQVGGAIGDWWNTRNASRDLDDLISSNPGGIFFKEGGLVQKYAEGGLVESDDTKMKKISDKLRDSKRLTPENEASFNDMMRAVLMTKAGKDLADRQYSDDGEWQPNRRVLSGEVEEGDGVGYADGGLINFNNVLDPFSNILKSISPYLPTRDTIPELMQNSYGGVFGNSLDTSAYGEMASNALPKTDPVTAVMDAWNSLEPMPDSGEPWIEDGGWDLQQKVDFENNKNSIRQAYEKYGEQVAGGLKGGFGALNDMLHKSQKDAGVKPASPEDASLPVKSGDGFTMDDLEEGKGSSAGVSMLPVVKGAEMMTQQTQKVGTFNEKKPSKNFMDNINKPLLMMGLAMMQSKGNFSQALGEGGAAYMGTIEKEEAKEAARAKAQLDALDKMTQIQKRQMETANLPYERQYKQAQTAKAYAEAAAYQGIDTKKAIEIGKKAVDSGDKVREALELRGELSSDEIERRAVAAEQDTYRRLTSYAGGSVPASKPSGNRMSFKTLPNK